VKAAQVYGGIKIVTGPDGNPAGALRTPADWQTPFPVLAPAAGALMVDQLASARPSLVLTSDEEYRDLLRIRQHNPQFRHPALDLWDAVHRDYAVAREFRPRPPFPGAGLFLPQSPPPDWSYYLPAVQVFRRR
jgi:hypothetical protein